MEKTVKEHSMKTKRRTIGVFTKGEITSPVALVAIKTELFFPFDANRLLDLSLLSSESLKLKACLRCSVVVCEVRTPSGLYVTHRFMSSWLSAAK